MENSLKEIPIIQSEEERLTCLKGLEILDTEIEEDLEELTSLAASICNTPIALITLVDRDRQWFKSHFGLEITQTERCYSFCHYTILGEGILEVKNTLLDERFIENPLVTSSPNMRYYCGAPLVTSDGFRIGSLCVIDTTARTLTDFQKKSILTLSKQIVKHFELKKQKSLLNIKNQNLEDQVQLRTVQLNETNNELKSFIYKASHDIRGPIATMIGLSELGNIKTTDPEMQFYFKHIIDTGYRLDTTLRNLLKVIQLNDKPLEISSVDTSRLLEEISLIKGQYNDSKVQFSIELSPNLYFNTDFELFEMILKNLIDNSVKFSNEKESVVIIRLISEEGFIKLSVEDNGDGIEEDIQDKIFNMFFRGNEKSKGSGLGLYIVKKAVVRLGGKIEFTSTLHKGSTFNIWLSKNIENQ